MNYVAHITPADGVPRRFALIAFDLADARREALLLARSLFGGRFSYAVRTA